VKIERTLLFQVAKRLEKALNGEGIDILSDPDDASDYGAHYSPDIGVDLVGSDRAELLGWFHRENGGSDVKIKITIQDMT
jgi:hypothetical protein